MALCLRKCPNRAIAARLNSPYKAVDDVLNAAGAAASGDAAGVACGVDAGPSVDAHGAHSRWHLAESAAQNRQLRQQAALDAGWARAIPLSRCAAHYR